MSKYHAWKSFEREIARDLQSIDPTARRNIEESREGSHDILNAMGLAIQCKHGLSPNPWKALEQAKRATKEDMPIAVLRRNKFGTVAVLYWKDFLTLLRYYESNNRLGLEEQASSDGELDKGKRSLQKDSLKHKEDSERLSSDLARTLFNRR